MKLLVAFIILLGSTFIHAQCSETTLNVQEIRAQDTDSNIPWELAKHYTFFNPNCTNRKILVVHLVGSYDNPTNNTMFPSFAANNGFHAICLKYPNSTAAQTACGGSSTSDCYNNFRKEIIEGGNHSPDVDVDITNSVNNRLLKLLQYLESNNPSENWNEYYNGNSIQWHKIIVSGHSQGGGHAAYIAKEHTVKRCLMFASPNDYSNFFSTPAPWLANTSATSESEYYGFNNLYDDVVDFSDQFEIWNELGMSNYGDSLNIDLTTTYTGSHQLYTTTTGPTANDNHSLMIRDDQTPLDGFGNAVFEPVWDYMLGIDVGLGISDIAKTEIKLYPNPAQNILKISAVSTPHSNLIIYDIHGNKIYAQQLKNELSSINIDFLPTGIYILNIESESEIIVTQKLIKID